jgi:hypothetical protein
MKTSSSMITGMLSNSVEYLDDGIKRVVAICSIPVLSLQTHIHIPAPARFLYFLADFAAYYYHDDDHQYHQHHLFHRHDTPPRRKIMELRKPKLTKQIFAASLLFFLHDRYAAIIIHISINATSPPPPLRHQDAQIKETTIQQDAQDDHVRLARRTADRSSSTSTNPTRPPPSIVSEAYKSR